MLVSRPCSTARTLLLIAGFASGLASCVSRAAPNRSFPNHAAPTTLERNLGAKLAENPAIEASLQSSLAAFVGAVQSGAVSEVHIALPDQEQHGFFMRAIRGLATKPDETAGVARVLKSYSPDGSSYLITIAFPRGREPGIHKILEFHAFPEGDGYRFRSPFEHRTHSLRTFDSENVRYHFNGTLDTDRAAEFARFKSEMEDRVGVAAAPLDYYRFDSLDQLLKAYGIVYDATKCNWLAKDLGFMDAGGTRFATGTGDEGYIFGYVRDFLPLHCAQAGDLYSPFVTGIAAYYGGYGLSGDDMATLKAQLRGRMEAVPETNFLHEFRNGRKSSVNRHFTFYVISALICQDLVERIGFQPVLRLAHSGKDGERFFTNLEAILEVDTSGFHAFVLRLIDGKE